jgi:hypothetical protein
VPYSPNKNPQNSQEEHENKKKIMWKKKNQTAEAELTWRLAALPSPSSSAATPWSPPDRGLCGRLRYTRSWIREREMRPERNRGEREWRGNVPAGRLQAFPCADAAETLSCSGDRAPSTACRAPFLQFFPRQTHEANQE